MDSRARGHPLRAEDLREACLRDGRFLVSTKRGSPYPHADAGGGGQAHLPRAALSGDRGLRRAEFKSIFDGHAREVPTEGLVVTARLFALGAVLVFKGEEL